MNCEVKKRWVHVPVHVSGQYIDALSGYMMHVMYSRRAKREQALFDECALAIYENIDFIYLI